MTDAIQSDRRIQKTLAALRDAFFDLVLTHSYEEIKVADIIGKANVGRSTFYQHYKSKDDILANSMHYPLSTLAACVHENIELQRVNDLMAHFWENRKFAPRIFSGTARRHITLYLAKLLESELNTRNRPQDTTPALPLALFVRQVAESQLTVVGDWLLGRGACSIDDMAVHLVNSTRALTIAWKEHDRR